MTSWTRARHSEAGEAIVPVDALPHMPYWEPFGEPAANQQDLLVQIDQERADDEEAAELRAAKAAETVKDGTVADVVEVVDGDPAAAAAALAAEQQKDQPRTTLVNQLEEIVRDPAEDTATTEGD